MFISDGGRVAGSPSEEEQQQGEQQPGAAQTAQPPVTPQYVTMDQLNQALERQAQEIVRRTGRQTKDLIQSKLASYSQMVEVQAKAGHPIDEEVQQATRQRIIQDALIGEEEPPPTQQPQPRQQGAQQSQARQAAPASDDDWATYVTEQMKLAFKRAGQAVSPDDPEWQPIKAALEKADEGSLEEVIWTVHQQAAQKKQRLASESDTARARTGASGGRPISAGNISQITDSTELYRIGEEHLAKQAGKGR